MIEFIICDNTVVLCVTMKSFSLLSLLSLLWLLLLVLTLLRPFYILFTYFRFDDEAFYIKRYKYFCAVPRLCDF